VGGDDHYINSPDNSNELLNNIASSLKKSSDRSITITGLMTNDINDKSANSEATNKAGIIRDMLIDLGVSKEQINIGPTIGNQPENTTQIRTNATLNVPGLPIDKSQIKNLNQ
jgi:coenzyme F420-reducing hydrogenase delta subunit